MSATRGSYGQVFFSNHSGFALCLLLASFVDPCIGMSGLISVVFTLLLASGTGLNPVHIRNGSYSFNSLLTGFALGTYFKLTGNLFFMILAASFLTFLITAWLSSVAERRRLPFLSLPFVFTLWILLLNTRAIEPGILIPRNTIYEPICSGPFVHLAIKAELMIPRFLALYLKSVAAIFFQSNVLTGLIISIGLLLHSRIAFILSWLGFCSGWACYLLVNGAGDHSLYSLTSFNYVLLALGLGGYYLVPSGGSFLLALLLTPVTALLANALSRGLAYTMLPVYSLPFSLAVILVISLLHNRYTSRYLQLVYFQQFSPEKNLYAFATFMSRFRKNTGTPVQLPFYGEWTVSQGHHGTITHQSNWRHAWDFVVTDEHRRSFKFPGKELSDFYCYGLPVLAPANGEVVVVEDGIDDNAPGDMNLERNWGNTVIIKHNDFLYSKLSHLKKNSFKVKPGDKVKKGDVLAACGNSGRSPEPHVHFQLQASEYIGAATLEYPLSQYVVKQENDYHLKLFDTPQEGDVLSRPGVSPFLKKSFHFIPGMKMDFDVGDGHKTYRESWEVFADAFNNLYLKCAKTQAVAYFEHNDLLFCFTGFTGSRQCLLYYFYLGAYQVLLSEVKGLQIKDRLSVHDTQTGIIKFVQDLVAPFYIFVKPEYFATFNIKNAQALTLVSQAKSKSRVGINIHFEMELVNDRIQTITIRTKNKCITAKHI